MASPRRGWENSGKIYDKDPKEIVENIQERCPHLRTSRSGTNAFKKITRCTQCGKVLSEELTELGIQKKEASMDKKN